MMRPLLRAVRVDIDSGQITWIVCGYSELRSLAQQQLARDLTPGSSGPAPQLVFQSYQLPILSLDWCDVEVRNGEKVWGGWREMTQKLDAGVGKVVGKYKRRQWVVTGTQGFGE